MKGVNNLTKYFRITFTKNKSYSTQKIRATPPLMKKNIQRTVILRKSGSFTEQYGVF